MSEKNSIISVIISTYNCANKIVTTLSSVNRIVNRQQIEVIIVDGNSSDGTLENIHLFESAVNQLITEPDAGIYDAWNKGLRVAHGNWIIFIGAGDEVCNEWIEFLSALKDDYDLVYGDVRLKNVKDGTINTLDSPSWDIAKKYFPHMMTIPHVGTAHHSSIFENDKFDSTYKVVGDWEFLTRGQIKSVFYASGIIQSVIEIGEGVTNSSFGVIAQYNEIKMILDRRNMDMLCSEKIKWNIKKLLCLSPALFAIVQSIHWKLKLIIAKHKADAT
jgi:glycosyltransferase involved in cell wall biosynthesis